MFCLLSMQIYLAPLCSSDVRVRRGLQRRLVAIVVSHLGGVSCLIECKSVDNIFPFLFFCCFFLRLARADRAEASRSEPQCFLFAWLPLLLPLPLLLLHLIN